MNTADNDPCPVCSGLQARLIYPVARDPITLDAFHVSECARCGVAYTDPRPDSLDRYYPKRYREYGSFVKAILGTFYARRVARWANDKPAGGSVLEIGCGPGLMLAAFAGRGWKALGIERNEEAATLARGAAGVEITAAPVEELPADRQFDLIVMFHVLEHIGEPVTLLKECAKRLAPGGRVIVNVPNFASWQSRFAGPVWLHLDVPRHLVHFTPQTLSATFEKAGLRVNEIHYASFEHDPYGWVESTLNRITGRANTLTRFLMGIEPWGGRVAFSILFGAPLVPAAFCLALVSWLFGKGALMEVSAEVPVETQR